jgi:tetratricopeptide (TPR) repeat protein
MGPVTETQLLAQVYPLAEKGDRESLKLFFERINFAFWAIKSYVAEKASFDPHLFSAKVRHFIEHFPVQELLQYSLEAAGVQSHFHVTDSVFEAIHAAAIGLYNQKHYKEAAAAFTVLTLLNPALPECWLGLGHAEYYASRYTAALIAYAMAVCADPANPYPHLWGAQCYAALKQYSLAINSLDLALLVMKNDQKLRTLTQKYRRHLLKL